MKKTITIHLDVLKKWVVPREWGNLTEEDVYDYLMTSILYPDTVPHPKEFLSTCSVSVLFALKKAMDKISDVPEKILRYANYYIVQKSTIEQLLFFIQNNIVTSAMFGQHSIQERDALLASTQKASDMLALVPVLYDAPAELSFKKSHPNHLEHVKKYCEWEGVKKTAAFLIENFRKNIVSEWLKTQPQQQWTLEECLQEPRLMHHAEQVEKISLKQAFLQQMKTPQAIWDNINLHKWIEPVRSIQDIEFLLSLQAKHKSVCNINVITFLRYQAAENNFSKDLDFWLLQHAHQLGVAVNSDWLHPYMKDDDFTERMPEAFQRVKDGLTIKLPEKRYVSILNLWIKKCHPQWKESVELYKMLKSDKKLDIFDVYNTVIAGQKTLSVEETNLII